jgi:hypothetical protein
VKALVFAGVLLSAAFAASFATGGAACGAVDFSACGAAVCGAAVCPSTRRKEQAIMAKNANKNVNTTMVFLCIESPEFQSSNL